MTVSNENMYQMESRARVYCKFYMPSDPDMIYKAINSLKRNEPLPRDFESTKLTNKRNTDYRGGFNVLSVSNHPMIPELIEILESRVKGVDETAKKMNRVFQDMVLHNPELTKKYTSDELQIINLLLFEKFEKGVRNNEKRK